MIALVVIPGTMHGQFAEYTRSASSIRILSQPIDIRDAMTSSDMVVNQGTHGVAAAGLLSGKPAVMLPLYLEQELTCQRISEMGAGKVVTQQSAQNLLDCVHNVLVNSTFTESAARFAEKYGNWSEEKRLASNVSWAQSV